jgi:hypothetical protein
MFHWAAPTVNLPPVWGLQEAPATNGISKLFFKRMHATLVSVELIDVSLTEISEHLATICSAVLSAASLCVFGFLRIPSLSARALALWNRGPIFAHCNFLGTCGNLSTATCWFGRPAKPLVAHETCGTLQIWHVWAVLNRLVLSERNLALPWR